MHWNYYFIFFRGSILDQSALFRILRLHQRTADRYRRCAKNLQMLKEAQVPSQTLVLYLTPPFMTNFEGHYLHQALRFQEVELQATALKRSVRQTLASIPFQIRMRLPVRTCQTAW